MSKTAPQNGSKDLKKIETKLGNRHIAVFAGIGKSISCDLIIKSEYLKNTIGFTQNIRCALPMSTFVESFGQHI